MATESQVARAQGPTMEIIKWVTGDLIQDAMPNLSDDQREYILTGLSPEEWDKLHGE